MEIKVYQERDFSRVINPLKKIGVNFYPSKQKYLPISIKGSELFRTNKYEEKKDQHNVKSCIMLASLNTPGEMIIKAKKSRDHTEKCLKI